MKIFTYIITAILLLVAQVTVVNLLAIKGIRPDLLLIYLILLTFKEGRIAGTISGFFLGLTYDAYAADFIGLSALTKSATAFIVAYFPKEMMGRGFFYVGGVLLGCSFFHDFIYSFIYSLGSQTNFINLVFRYVIFSSLYTTFLGLIIYEALPPRMRKIDVES